MYMHIFHYFNYLPDFVNVICLGFIFGFSFQIFVLISLNANWRRKWQPTLVFLPGGSQGRGSLVGCHLWGCTESDMTEAIQQQGQFSGSLGSWSRCSHSKGSGLDLWSGMKISQVVFIELSEIKTNIQKQETKDEPQINSSYKISQITIKIIEYTLIHIHP